MADTATPSSSVALQTARPQKKRVAKIPGKEIWRKICGQQVSGIAGGRWRRQHRTELDGDK